MLTSSPPLYVGIDLGTSRSAVCASNGRRRWIESLVGWPKDIIARKLVGRSVIFGEESQRLRLSLELYRPMQSGVVQKGPDRGEEAARELVRHLVTLADPAEGQAIFVVVGAPSRASAYDKQSIRDALEDQVEAVMVVSEPFTVAYALGLLDRALIVDIGGGTMDLCLMHGTIPTAEDEMSLPQAGDTIDSRFEELLAEAYPEAGFSRKMVRRIKEQYGFIGPSRSPVHVTLPVAGRPTEFDITVPLRRACESILPYVREAIWERIAAADPEIQAEVRQNVVLAGGTSQLRGLAGWIEGVLAELGGGRVRLVNDPVYTGADGALAIAMDTPGEDWARLRDQPDLVL
jgi:rod shape-determining protein MreB